MLRGEKVTKRFGGLVAVKEADFQVNKGEIVGLIGPNGAGKTTLLNLITGIYKPDSGRIWFDGINITGLEPHVICKLGMGRTFQTSQSFQSMTVMQNVIVGCVFGKPRSSSTKEVTHEALSVLELVGLGEKAHVSAKSLNSIELKKLELARALATEPKLLLLDEISTGLNPAESKETVKLIEDIRGDGVTVLVVEHVMKVIMSLCDRIIVLHHGDKIAEGTPEQISSDATVIKAYLGEKYLL